MCMILLDRDRSIIIGIFYQDLVEDHPRIHWAGNW